MAVIDMPLAELVEYKGQNPCPADFDAFWEKSIAEMKAIDPQVEMIASDFPSPVAECFDLFFTGTQGARIHAKLLKPARPAGKCPALLMFHGYGGSAGDWYDKLGYVAAGFIVAALDCRGQAGLSEDTGVVRGDTQFGQIIRGLDDAPEKLYYRQVFLDTAQLASIVLNMPEVDKSRVYSSGGSQGGALALVCAALEPAVSKTVSLFPFLSDYKRIWELDVETTAYVELRNYFRKRDPLHQREEEIFTKLGYIDVQHFAPRIRAEVMMAISLRDDVCPPSTQFAVYNKLGGKHNLLFYKDFGHENLPTISDKAYRFFVS